MSTQLLEKAQQLREAVRHFVAHEMTAELKAKSHRHQVLDRQDYLQWMQLLERKGWAVGHWPEQYGGQQWSSLERFVFEDELARLGCPWIIPFGVKYVGPVIYSFGSEQQKQRFLPGIVKTEEFWAQGYSEPGAGSDLAGLRTRAVRNGDHYVVNGQKVWTTYAQWADWLFCLVRTGTDGKPQSGISFLLIDMRSPGVTVKPIHTMDGYHHVNEVWLEDVIVPAENLVGEEGAGWTYAKFLLQNERTAGAIVGQAWHVLDRLKKHAAETLVDGRPLLEQPLMRNRIGEFELRFLALEQASYAGVLAMDEKRDNGGEASLIKIRGTELYQQVSDTLVDALAEAGMVFDTEALHATPGLPLLGADDVGGILKEHLYNRANTIFGGSSEVQRNILAKVVLGL
ncbi:acyl-CoA dehydrogenase family protein [Pseudomonas sp. MYb185]|uniref:acyl-CoA dehydrogenase family protein n=1 Tax=Pseudomonas sp. MYb185 TaxID=1848729 RepID=UPI000CFB5CFF|nr:acyl-CoA dehydrogenase family protein [Pseudomonas sp. MYb185]PRB84103.1 acyl-CoA dehydrogenase [Pseudomonas sp. MYb185]